MGIEAEGRPKELKLIVASTSLLVPGTLPMVESPLEGTVFEASIAGYPDGISFRPLPWYTTSSFQIKSGFLSPYALSHILAAEQSFRGEKTWKEASKHPNKRLAQVSFFLFPHRTESLNRLAQLQELKPNLPVTLYPAIPGEIGLQLKLHHRLVELSHSIAHGFGATSLPEFLDTIKQRGLGISYDTVHAQELAKKWNFSITDSLLQSLLPEIGEVQLSLARTDIAPQDVDTQKAFIEAQTESDPTKYTSQDMKILVRLLELGYRGNITVELPPFSIPEVNKKPWNLFITHRKITNNLRTLFQRIG